jgi:hypothetical protein
VPYLKDSEVGRFEAISYDIDLKVDDNILSFLLPFRKDIF